MSIGFEFTITLVTAALAQTRNSKYEVTVFRAPPLGQDVWSLPRAVAVDGKGTVIVFRAFQPPVLVFNRAGQLQKTWGDGVFTDAHSIDFDREGFLWLTDRRNQMAYKYTADGKQLMALGRKDVAGDNSSILDQQQTAKNPRIQVFDQNGNFIEQWTNIEIKALSVGCNFRSSLATRLEAQLFEDRLCLG